MELRQAVDFARSHRQSVLVTLKRDGRPQLSNVMHAVDDDGVIGVSITATRAKYKNLQRDPWTAVHVSRGDFFAYVVLECDAELSEVAQRPDDATVDQLVELHRRISGGEHDDWDEYRRAMVADRRVVLRLTPTRAYGML